MRWIRGLAAISLLIGLTGTASSVRAQEESFPLDVAPIWAVVEGAQLCCGATLEDQIIGGQSWADGDEIELFINGEYVATTFAEPNDEGSATPVFDVNALGIGIEPGDEVKLVRTDGGRTEVHIVTPLNVSMIDVRTDTVSGTAEPGTKVWVFVPNTLAFRVETVGAQGRWAADFSVSGDQVGEEATFDIEVFTTLGAAQFDVDGNTTLWLTVAASYAPIIVAVEGADLIGSPSAQIVGGQSWVVGEAVDLYVNEEYVATAIAEPNAEGSASPFFDVNALGVIIQPGDVVEFVGVDGGRVEVHIVTELTVTSVDTEADAVAGTAAPGSEAIVFAESAARFVTADEMGDWLADFSQPGDPSGQVVDLVSTSLVRADQYDDDGNATVAWASASPTNKDQCKGGGWDDFGVFKNQGQCVKTVTH